MIFQSERLCIRMLKWDDYHDLHKLQSNPNVMKYITNQPKSFEETEKELIKILQCYEEIQNDFLVFAVCHHKSKEFIGTCAIIKNDEKNYEIGYRLQEEHWGNGYGSELTKGLISYCFEDRKIDTIIATVESNNLHSVKILEKNGFMLISKIHDENIGDLVKTYQKDKK